MDYSQINFLNDFEFVSTFSETNGASRSGQHRVINHALPIHNRTEPCRTTVDNYASGTDLRRPSHLSFHTPYVPWFPAGSSGVPPNLPRYDQQMGLGYLPPATNLVDPNAGNPSPPPAFFAAHSSHVRRQRPLAIYVPPLYLNQPYSLHHTRGAEPNLSNVPSLGSLANGLGSEMTSDHTQSFSPSPCPTPAQANGPSTSGAQTAPQTTYNYQCLWGACGQLIHGDQNNVRKHLKTHHAVTLDKTRVICLWGSACGSATRGDTIARHIVEKHLRAQWACSKCGARFLRKDEGRKYTKGHGRADCAGADLFECPGPGAIYMAPDATSVLTASSTGSYHPVSPVT
ncbi:hypothetical protein BV22DRAFT_1037430 [Leucogyrophana mollusca]|uniref:Uncharacterized protein n=1 Tax=Leucogyrophana mollusca TaxID=85980 RepID=A0ACB8BAZ1_9AGAM|nr:hypothetical protein BV22DRAFT_1037430 [Leucogyrophana mollusca]